MGLEPSAEFPSPEAAVDVMGRLLDEGKAQEALAFVDPIAAQFPDSPVAQHLCGLVCERTYIELTALGKAADFNLYRQAEHFYRRAAALETDEGAQNVHRERLYAAVFVIGTQQSDPERLREAYDLALELADTSEEVTIREKYGREAAIVATAMARVSRQDADWRRAERLFSESKAPFDERETYFFHYYQGLVARELGQRLEDEARLASAADRFRRASSIQTSRGVDYLLADCLIQLSSPNPEDLSDMDRIVAELMAANPDDPLVASLKKRYELRKRLLEGETDA
ncbi:MAG: hypothetical protein RLY93_02595 [Sumerlaeia bacterium]